jgi:fumarate hydratase class II
MADKDFRREHDSMGVVAVPAGAPWGAQTQRALENVRLSARVLPAAFIQALALIKWAAARANTRLAGLDPAMARAIEAAALAVADGGHADAFPLDVFQTGSGTSSNMNVNEVIAHLASASLGAAVHPNDDVNRSQSSNDCVPSAVHVSAALALERNVRPAFAHLSATIGGRLAQLDSIVKTGRTHLMDAMPLTLAQEIGGWHAQMQQGEARLRSVLPRLYALAQGGTAVGTGINARKQFGAAFARRMAAETRLPFVASKNYFAALSSQDTSVELSGQLKALAVGLMKIANDLRWMNSGPLAGLAEISLPALQPGSSIMPGKVNPVVPEAVAMQAAQVIGNDVTITVAGQSGNFQLNVMLPVIAYNLLQSIELLSIASRNLCDRAIKDFTVNTARLNESLERNPILITALNAVVGYEKGAAIAKTAYAEQRPIIDVAAEMTGMEREKLRALLNPLLLTGGGIK